MSENERFAAEAQVWKNGNLADLTMKQLHLLGLRLGLTTYTLRTQRTKHALIAVVARRVALLTSGR